jgi:hypothetical protein
MTRKPGDLPSTIDETWPGCAKGNDDGDCDLHCCFLPDRISFWPPRDRGGERWSFQNPYTGLDLLH